jgi:cGMP-dependent protein kinase
MNRGHTRSEEEKGIRSSARKDLKNKHPIQDPRRGSQLSIESVSATISERYKTSKEAEMISSALNKHFIFTSLSSENRAAVMNSMKFYVMGPNEVIFEQNSPGTNFYVITAGKIEVFVNGKQVNILGPGDSFGELALLHDSPRSASVYTIEIVQMWVLDRKTFRSAVKAVNTQHYMENKKFIDSVPLFNLLTPTQRETLVGSLSSLKFRQGERIVKEGDPGDLFYIISEGKVLCSQKGENIREMEKGDFFGEQALLYNSMRTATITAVTEVKCVAIGRNKLNTALGSQLQQILYRNSIMIAFEQSEYLSRLQKSQKIRLIDLMKVSSHFNGKTVFQSGPCSPAKMVVVVKGCLKTSNRTLAQVFQVIGDKDMFSTKEQVFEQDIRAGEDTILAEIIKSEFDSCLGGRIEHINLNPDALSDLKNTNIFRMISSDKFACLINSLKSSMFSDKEIIIQQNTPGDTFFIIHSGKVDIVKDGILLRTVTKFDYFGERSMLFNDFRSASVIANGPVTCWYLNRSDFFSILDDSLRDSFIARIELQDDSITLKDLVAVKLLGKGMFGNVFLVLDKSKKRLYALKTVSRKKIQRYEIQENLVLERKILMALDHVMILKLIKTFKDDKRIYLLTEFVKGTDLFDAIRVLNLLNDSDAKFYTACLIIVLEYLHDRDIAYRDLKPENIMIDENGYPKLIDFGVAKILNGRTFTVVGTPHYMAPEVIVGKGYNFLSDYWSLGVIIYEFFCGGVPFGEGEEDPYVVYEKILERRLEYPSFAELTSNAKNFIEVLLNKNPVMRNAGSCEKLKSHGWFRNLNWENLMKKQIKAPLVPNQVDLNHDIENAVSKHMSIEEVIAKEEMHDEQPDNVRRRPKPIPQDWDQEF